MDDGENTMTQLVKLGKMLGKGKYTRHDLDYIKKMLEEMLKATDKAINKDR